MNLALATAFLLSSALRVKRTNAQLCTPPLEASSTTGTCGEVVTWPTSASRVSCAFGGSTCGVFSGVPVELALVGPCLNGGAINIRGGDVFEVVFADGIQNGPGDDFIVFDARFSADSVSIEIGGTTNLVDIGCYVSCDQSLVLANTGFAFSLFGAQLDLSDWGIADDAVVNTIRFTGTGESDVVGIGALSPSVQPSPRCSSLSPPVSPTQAPTGSPSSSPTKEVSLPLVMMYLKHITVWSLKDTNVYYFSFPPNSSTLFVTFISQPTKAPSSSPSKSPSTSPSSSPTKADLDGDGVFDDEDECLGTTEENVPEIELKPNHFVLGSDGINFIKGATKGNGKGTDKSFTIQDTRGCSCEQIIENLELGNGHRKFGCSPGIMDCWVNDNCDDEDLFDRNLRG